MGQLDSTNFYDQSAGGYLSTIANWSGAPTEALRKATSQWADAFELAGNNPFILPSVRAAFHAGATITQVCAQEQPRPKLNITNVDTNSVNVAVTEHIVERTAFSTLKQLRKDMPDKGPITLILPPFSGHYETLLRGTAQKMLEDCDVYMPSWHDPKDVPLEAGPYDLSTMINEIKNMVRKISASGEAVHIVAVCQPTVAALAAVSELARENIIVASLTLIAGPNDVRMNPTKINEVVSKTSLSWMANNMFNPVPAEFAGAGRMILPKYLQLAGFMTPNIEKHLLSLSETWIDIFFKDDANANRRLDFYREYFAVMDLPAEFILETVQKVFKNVDMALGRFSYRDENGKTRRVDPSRIQHTLLQTVEGSKDDICGISQTAAAHDFCKNIPDDMKRAYLEAGAGHYGTFEKSKFRNNIYPFIRTGIFTAQDIYDNKSAAPRRLPAWLAAAARAKKMNASPNALT